MNMYSSNNHFPSFFGKRRKDNSLCCENITPPPPLPQKGRQKKQLKLHFKKSHYSTISPPCMLADKVEIHNTRNLKITKTNLNKNYKN